MKTLEQRLRAVTNKRHRRQLHRWRTTGKLPKQDIVYLILSGAIEKPENDEQAAIFAYLRHRDINPRAWGSVPRLAMWELIGGSETRVEPSAIATLIMGDGALN